MQANSKQSGQLQKFTPGDGTPKILRQNIYQQCVSTNSAKSSYPGQTTPENHLKKVTIQQANREQNLTSSIQAKRAQENKFHPIYTLPTGIQDSQIILWNVPSNCQIFVPVQNLNLPVAPTDNPPSGSHCAFKSNSSLYVQQKTTSLAAGPNISPQVKAKPIDTISRNEARRDVNTINLNNRQQHANAPNLTPGSSKTRLSLPSDLKYKPTENASQSNSFSGCYNQVMVPEKATHANVQALSTCVQNTWAQRAIAVVTPLSPIGTTPVDATDESANIKINARSVQDDVQHLPNVPHTLEACTNLRDQTENKNEPTSENQQPKSAEPRLNGGCGAESPVITAKSVVQSHFASLPKLKRVEADPEKSNSAPMQTEPSKNINTCTITNNKTGEAETIPFIKWPLDRLHTLTNMMQQIENSQQKNVHKNDAGKEILKFYWNGDYRKFLEAVQTGIYENVMEEVFLYCSMKEPVILRQIKSDARNRVIKDFQTLNHNEEPPKTTYKSSWLNLNENVDDIDKECGYSWFYRSCQNFTEPTQNYTTTTSSEFQEAAEMPSPPRFKPTAVENKVLEEATRDKKTTPENLSVVYNGQSPSALTINSSPKHNGMVTEKNKSQTNITNTLEDVTTGVKDSDQQDVLNGMFISENQCCNDAKANHLVLPKYTNQSDCTTSPKLNREFAFTPEENSASALQSALLPVTPLAEHNQHTVEMRKDVGDQTLSDKTLDSESLCKKSPPMTDNCAVKPNVDHKQVISQPNTTTPLNGLANLVRIIKKRQELLKCQNLSGKNSSLKRKHQPSSPPRLNGSLCNTAGAKSPVSPNGTSAQSDCTNPLALSPEAEVQRKSVPLTSVQKGSSQILMNSDCGTHDTISKPGQESSVTTNEEEIVEMDTSAPLEIKVLPREMAQQYFEQNMTTPPNKTDDNYSQKCSMFIEQTTSESNTVHPLDGTSPDNEVDSSASFMINVLPHEVAKQCFAGEFMENEVISSALEKKSCLLNSIQYTTTTKGQISMPRLEEMDKCSSKGTVVSEQTNGLGEAMAGLDGNLSKGTKRPVLTGSMNRSCNESPPKLYPVITEPCKILNESTVEIPVLDCMLKEESVGCKTDQIYSDGLNMDTNEEINKIDALDSIQISVLSHEAAELWFAGEVENKDLNNDTGVHISTKDQDECQDLELNEVVVLEDVKPKRSSGKEELDSFCCLAKWFQTLDFDNGSLCMCHKKSELSEKGSKPIHDSSLDVQTNEVEECGIEIISDITEDSDTTEDSEMECFEIQEDSETKEDDIPKDPTMDRTENKDVSRSEEACAEDTETSEQTRDGSPLKCAANATLNHNEIEQDAQVADFKMKTSSVFLALYGSSSGTKKEVMPTKRYKGIESCEDPPETLQITMTSNENIKVQRKSPRCKSVESEAGVDENVPFKNVSRCENLPSNPVSELSKNAISPTSIRKILNPNANGKFQYKKRKRQNKCTTQQMSMNKFVIRGKNGVSNLPHPLANVLKSKYELGNPALMPLEGTALEFKVLPESFNFQDGAELEMSLSTQNATSVPDDDEAKRMKSGGSTAQGVWSFSPLKKKRTQSNQATDVIGPCSLFQEFKKKYQEKREITFKQT